LNAWLLGDEQFTNHDAPTGTDVLTTSTGSPCDCVEFGTFVQSGGTDRLRVAVPDTGP
jgi:hypothetical protein